jgi:hypothetical protein
MLEWAMVTPFFAALYEAFPVWVWEKQGPEEEKHKTSAAIKNFIKCSLVKKTVSTGEPLETQPGFPEVPFSPQLPALTAF